jgi:hypothetical protein
MGAGRLVRRATVFRVAFLSAVLVALALAPASAQAQESGDITGAQFTPSEDFALTPNTIAGEEPPNGLLCLPPAGSAGTEVNCGGDLPEGMVGTLTIQTEDPCGNDFALRDLALDTGADEDPMTVSRDVVFGTVTVDCDGSGGAVTEDGCTARLTAVEGENTATFTIVCVSEDGGGDDPGGDDGGAGDGEDDGDPEGGVDAGFGGAAESPTAGSAGLGLPLAIGGGLILLGLLGGAVSLARRP